MWRFIIIIILTIMPVTQTSEDACELEVLQTQADLPISLGESALNIVRIGGIELEDSTPLAKRLEMPTESLIFQVESSAPVFPNPDPETESVGMIEPDEMVQADGLSQDEAWVRVNFSYLNGYNYSVKPTAWLSVDDVPDDASNLPILTGTSRTPMQSINIVEPVEAPDCEEPPMMIVQGPHAIEANIFVNEVPARISSSLMVRIINDRLEITALEGIIRLYPETDDEIILAPGFTTFACLAEFPEDATEPLSRVLDLDICAWTEPQILTGAGAPLSILQQLEDSVNDVLETQLPTPELVPFSCIEGDCFEILFDLTTNSTILDGAVILCELGILDAPTCEILGLTT